MVKDLAINCISEQIKLKEIHKAMLAPNVKGVIINRFIHSLCYDIKDMEYNDNSDLLTEEINQLKDTIRLIKDENENKNLSIN